MAALARRGLRSAYPIRVLDRGPGAALPDDERILPPAARGRAPAHRLFRRLRDRVRGRPLPLLVALPDGRRGAVRLRRGHRLLQHRASRRSARAGAAGRIRDADDFTGGGLQCTDPVDARHRVGRVGAARRALGAGARANGARRRHEPDRRQHPRGDRVRIHRSRFAGGARPHARADRARRGAAVADRARHGARRVPRRGRMARECRDCGAEARRAPCRRAGARPSPCIAASRDPGDRHAGVAADRGQRLSHGPPVRHAGRHDRREPRDHDRRRRRSPPRS